MPAFLFAISIYRIVNSSIQNKGPLARIGEKAFIGSYGNVDQMVVRKARGISHVEFRLRCLLLVL